MQAKQGAGSSLIKGSHHLQDGFACAQLLAQRGVIPVQQNVNGLTLKLVWSDTSTLSTDFIKDIAADASTRLKYQMREQGATKIGLHLTAAAFMASEPYALNR